MAEKVYVPGYGYVTQGSAGTGGKVGPGPKPFRTGQEPAGFSIGALGRTVAATGNNSSSGVPPFVPDEQPAANGYVDPNMYYNTLPIGRYGPPGGIGGPLAQGTGEPGTSVRELPALFNARTVGDAKVAFWSDPASRQLITQAAEIFYEGNPNFIPQWAEGFWNDLINASINPGSPSPWEMLELILSGRDLAAMGADSSSTSGGGGYGGGGYGGGGMGSVSLTDPTSARGLLLQTMQGVLGRNPTSKEYKDFLDTLNRVEMENPRTVSIEGDVAVQSGGTDPAAIAMDFAENRPDARRVEMRRATDLLLTAMGGI